MNIHKETFRQDAHDGIPTHYVVQYWVDNPNTFPESSYFSTLVEAVEFEKTLTTYDQFQMMQK